MSPVDLSFEKVWCREHMEVFRGGYPMGAVPATLALIQLAAEDPRINPLIQVDDLERSLEALLKEFSPLCCFVSDEALQRAYEVGGKRSV